MTGERDVLTVREVQEVLCLGRTKVYAMIRGGELPTMRIGRVVGVPRAALDAWIIDQTRSGRVA
jgi:excisionase family DNA binding protein